LDRLDASIVLLSLIIVLIVGWYSSRREGKTARAYFLASDSLPWFAIGASWVATSVSSEQIVGTVGMAYKAGMGVANWEWFSWPITTLMLVFFIPVYLRNRITTIPDFLNRRFGSFCGDFYSIAMLVAYVFIFMATILYSGTLAFSDLTGINFWVVLLITVVITGIYTVKGGLAAVVWTDLVQCVMLLAGGLILFFLALNFVPGGWAGMMQANPERFHLVKPINDPYAPFLGLIVASFGVFLFYNAANQTMIQRVLGARTRWDGMMGMIFGGFINLLRPMVTCFLGFVVFRYTVLHGQTLENPNLVFTFALKTFAPTGLRGVILAGFLAAVMSSTSATANSAATIFSLDIYKRWIRPGASDRDQVRIGKIACAVILLIAAAWCPIVGKAETIFTYFQTGVTYLATPFISVCLVGIFSRRVGYVAAVIGLCGGVIIQVLVAVISRLLLSYGYITQNVHWLYLAFLAELLTILLICVASLFTPSAQPDRIKGLVWEPSAVWVTRGETKRPWWQSLLLWYSIYAVIWFGLYIYFR
jgi:SSS family solute:Na+ symporter